MIGNPQPKIKDLIDSKVLFLNSILEIPFGPLAFWRFKNCPSSDLVVSRF